MVVQEVDRLRVRDGIRTVRGIPRILCWKCRELTPFELDQCQHCGTAFAGSTGGAYGRQRAGLLSAHTTEVEAPGRRRSISELIADLQKISHSSAEPAHGPPQVEYDSGNLFQCPSCNRFVAEDALSCECGVRFAEAPTASSACPECGSLVPTLEDACPVCGIELEPGLEETAYTCPRCGSHVALDAVQCNCGVWFED